MIRNCMFVVLTTVWLGSATMHVHAADVSLTIEPERVLNRIDEKIYGHFLEHIYHSCNGGLWGDLIWNRSFEQNKLGQWHVEDGQVAQDSMATDQRLVFGDPQWGDYEFSLEAKKVSGDEGFLVLFRVNNKNAFYWANLGGWGNRYHRIERGSNDGNRWGGIGPQVPGQIETGRWYRIRVRCEGPRFQVFLDDKKVIDLTDDAHAHLRGMVGVGTWATRARFRKMRVTTLSGSALFEGVPSKVSRPSVASQWALYGEGDAYVERQGALNANYCQRIVGHGKEVGVQQGPINVVDGEAYVGSVWARGKSTGPIVVRLVGGDKTLATTELGQPTANWHEFPIKLTARAASPDAMIQVGITGQGDVCLDQVSLMPRSWRAQGGFRPDLLKAIAELRPPIIRWPGGCFASAYRWKQAIGPQAKRLPHPREIWDDLDVYSFGTDEFIAMCRRVGAEPLIVVNIGTKTWNGPGRSAEFLQETCDWIEYCNSPADSKWGKIRAANGHPEPYHVKYWEIDNETWHMGAEEYAEAVNLFGPAMRKVDPSIKLIACGSGGYDQNWNRTLIARAGKNFDYISTHHYENPSRFATGPEEDERFYRDLAKIIRTGPNPEIKIDCSEWNAQSTDWRTGLYCGGILNVFERCGDFFAIGGPALFLRHVSARAWDNAFVNFDHRSWFPAPNYVVMKLWHDHYVPCRIALNGKTEPLNAVATKSADGKRIYLKVVNPTDREVSVEVKLDATSIRTASMQIVAPGSLAARNSLESPHRVQPRPGDVQVVGQTIRFQMPRISCGVVDVQCR